jgi:hypothetical protein
MYQFALGRDASPDEIADALEFVDRGNAPSTAKLFNQLAWQFGWGVWDEAAGKVQFNAMPHYTGNTWQGGPATPDPTLGWASLTSDGGHPGDATHQTIRRWTAPVKGTLHIEGVLSHPAQAGDGVRGRIVSSRSGLVGAWDVFHAEASTAPPQVPVEAGDTIDFVTDCRAAIEHDTYTWPVTLRLTPAEKKPTRLWDSISGFHGPIVPPLSRWEQLAQVLFMSNEFMFID